MDNKVKLYIAMTLDGYIAKLDESLDWLMEVQGKGDNGYANFYSTIDTVVMGRKTYDWVMDNLDEYPYYNCDSLVLTSRTIEDNKITTVNSVDDLVSKIKAENGKNIWILGGGIVITELLDRELIDEMKITIAPVLLGNGINLFQESDVMHKLWLNHTTVYNQFVELDYSIIKNIIIDK